MRYRCPNCYRDLDAQNPSSDCAICRPGDPQGLRHFEHTMMLETGRTSIATIDSATPFTGAPRIVSISDAQAQDPERWLADMDREIRERVVLTSRKRHLEERTNMETVFVAAQCKDFKGGRSIADFGSQIAAQIAAQRLNDFTASVVDFVWKSIGSTPNESWCIGDKKDLRSKSLGDIDFISQDELKRLREAEVDAKRYKNSYDAACRTIAEMHAAATGRVGPPIRGVVEDVRDLAERVDAKQTRIDLLEQEIAALRHQIAPRKRIEDHQILVDRDFEDHE